MNYLKAIKIKLQNLYLILLKVKVKLNLLDYLITMPKKKTKIIINSKKEDYLKMCLKLPVDYLEIAIIKVNLLEDYSVMLEVLVEDFLITLIPVEDFLELIILKIKEDYSLQIMIVNLLVVYSLIYLIIINLEHYFLMLMPMLIIIMKEMKMEKMMVKSQDKTPLKLIKIRPLNLNTKI